MRDAAVTYVLRCCCSLGLIEFVGFVGFVGLLGLFGLLEFSVRQ